MSVTISFGSSTKVSACAELLVTAKASPSIFELAASKVDELVLDDYTTKSETSLMHGNMLGQIADVKSEFATHQALVTAKFSGLQVIDVNPDLYGLKGQLQYLVNKIPQNQDPNWLLVKELAEIVAQLVNKLSSKPPAYLVNTCP